MPAGVGGGGGGGGTPGSPASATFAAPTGDTGTKAKPDKVKQQDNGLPGFPALPDEKEIEKWLKQMLKDYERMQREGGGGTPVMAFMASSLTAEQATNNSMGFYIVLNAADDLNGDGVPDGLAAQLGVNPLNDLTQTDTDGDGLTDQQEIVFGSDPTKVDTDGDGLSDAQELALDSDPRNPLGAPSIRPRFYQEQNQYPFQNSGVTWTNYYTLRYQWGQGAWQTNRDWRAVAESGVLGTTLVKEWGWTNGDVSNAIESLWADYVDGSRVLISVNTNSGAYPFVSEPWKVGIIDGMTYQTQLAMVTHGTNSALKRAYEFQLEAWTGTTFATATPITNFSGFTIMGQAATADGKTFMLLPETTFTNVSVTAPAQYAQLIFKVNPVLILIDIQEVISDQIATNECNKLPTAFYAGEGNNPMLMATRSGTDARIAVRVAYATALRTNVVVGVRKVGSPTILASAPAQQAPDRTLLQFTAENGSKTYEVVAGYDFNSNGILDASEVVTVFSKTPKTDSRGNPVTKSLEFLDKFIVVTELDFTTAKSRIGNWVVIGNLTLGFAADLLDAFVNGKTNVPSAVTTFGVPINSSSPGLSHKVGAKWNANCEDTTYRFTYANGSPASIAVRDSAGMTNVLDQVVRASLADLLASGSPLFVSSTNIPISSGVDFFKTDKVSKVGLAFGKVTFNGTMTLDYFASGPGEITVTRFLFDGSFDDTYDYAYFGKPLDFLILSVDPKEPARVQAGYATLSTPTSPSGKVFFIHLDLNTGWRTLNRVYRP